MKSKTFSKMAPVGYFVGMAISLGGLGYVVINSPSMTPALKKYHQIERELDKSPQIRLGDLESRSAKLIVYVDRLKTEKYQITSKPGFAEVKNNYESERKNGRRMVDYSLGFGTGLMLLGLISGGISSAKEMKEKESNRKKDGTRYTRGTM